jgi:hypothetical protein
MNSRVSSELTESRWNMRLCLMLLCSPQAGLFTSAIDPDDPLLK